MSDIKVRFIVPPKDKQIGGISAALAGLEKMLKTGGIEVVYGPDFSDVSSIHHVHGLWNLANSLSCLELQKRGLPYIVSPHGMLEPWALANKGVRKRAYLSLLERRVLLGAKKLFVTSDMERRHVLSLLGEVDTEVHRLGSEDARTADYLQARQRLGWETEDQVVLFLSRIDPKKGLDLLLDALTVDDGSYKNVSLVIVGDGEPAYVNSLKRRAQSLSGRLRRVTWVGPVWGGERWSYFQGADLMCLPTHSENFGIVVLEALLTGTPVITTDRTPWADYRRHGLEITCPDRASLRKDIRHMIFSTSLGWTLEERLALSEWALSEFSWEKLAQSYIRSYRQIRSES